MLWLRVGVHRLLQGSASVQVERQLAIVKTWSSWSNRLGEP
ncbi:MAG: hypothetical protein ACM37W_26760 [Actinomycetota bacterium]